MEPDRLAVDRMTALVEVAQGVVAGFHFIKPGVDLLVTAFSQLGAKLGESVGYLFGSTLAARENGGAWVSLGKAIAFVVGVVVGTVGVLVSVVSAAVAVVSAAIQAVVAVFSGLADAFTGVVFIVGGLINGSWTEVWTGMKLLAFGVVDAIRNPALQCTADHRTLAAAGWAMSSSAQGKGKRRHERKTERLELRVAPSVRRMIERATAISGLAAGDLAYEGARRILEEHERMVLRGADAEAFLRAVEHPPAPSARLVAALRRRAALD